MQGKVPAGQESSPKQDPVPGEKELETPQERIAGRQVGRHRGRFLWRRRDIPPIAAARKRSECGDILRDKGQSRGRFGFVFTIKKELRSSSGGRELEAWDRQSWE